MEDTDRRAEIRHYPMRLLKAIQARKQSRRGEKVKQRRQIHSQQQIREGRTIHLAEEKTAARKAKQRNKQLGKKHVCKL